MRPRTLAASMSEKASVGARPPPIDRLLTDAAQPFSAHHERTRSTETSAALQCGFGTVIRRTPRTKCGEIGMVKANFPAAKSGQFADVGSLASRVGMDRIKLKAKSSEWSGIMGKERHRSFA
ncbi:MAG: hypothetical protein R2748_18165 [Bryobacterales bacterium]